MNGGYIMIYKSSKKIYLELFACLTLGKPILWYEDKNTCFFIDTISGGEISTEIVDDEEVRVYGDIILTKGGMTITITAENVVTEVGDIQPSSGVVLYNHNIQLHVSGYRVNINLVLSNSEPLTTNDVATILSSSGYTSQSNMFHRYDIVGINFTTPTYVQLRGIYVFSNSIYLRTYDSASGNLLNRGNASVESDDVIPV